MVEFKDEKGQLIKKGLVDYKGLYHLATVVVTGTVKKVGKDFLLEGKSVYLRKPSPMDAKTWEAKKKKDKDG